VTSDCPRSLGKRAAMLCLCALLALSVVSAHAPTAMSAGLNNPLGELTERESAAAAARKTTATTAATTTESSSNSSTVVILALLAAGALLVAIAFVIVRDARRVAPVTDAELASGASPGDSAARLRRRRAKAKAARQQRKRNR
jgi:hypothetical protein